MPQCADGAVASRHEVTRATGPIAYRACAGTLAIRQDGTELADLFYTAYLAEGGDADRPLAFIWNGGPGADSALLHFGALGPMLLRDGRLVENPVTPLGTADLVFLDPAGTGFSRAASDEAARMLYSTNGDIVATRLFVEAFLEAYGRTASPIVLIGESFGTWRAAGTAEALIDAGRPVAGLALISGGIPLGPDRDRAQVRALSLTNRTATALALGRLAPDLQADPRAAMAQAAAFARQTWYPALSDLASLDPDRRAAVIAGLERYMGLPAAAIDPETLWVSPRQFREELLQDRGIVLDVFDMRRPTGTTGRRDDRAIVAYFRNRLGYKAGAYAGVEAEPIAVGAKWQYDQSPITPESLARAIAGEGPPSPSQPWILRAMRKDPHLRGYVATGLYDSLNSCENIAAVVAALPDATGDRFTAQCYRGGHMMYEVPQEAIRFGNDVTAFIANAR